MPPNLQGQTITNTVGNRNYYKCNFATMGSNRCTTEPCASTADSKTFIGNTYWAGQWNYAFYDATLESCASGSGAPTQSIVDCHINRCRELCIEQWGSNCVSYTYDYPSWTQSYVSKCYTFGMDCLSSDNDLSYGTPGFAETQANAESYGSVYNPWYAVSYFCHQYSRRALEEKPEERPSWRRSLWNRITGGKEKPKEDAEYLSVKKNVLDMGTNFTNEGKSIRKSELKKQASVVENSDYAYGGADDAKSGRPRGKRSGH